MSPRKKKPASLDEVITYPEPTPLPDKPVKAEQPVKIAVSAGRIVHYVFESPNGSGKKVRPAIVVAVLDASGTADLCVFSNARDGYTAAARSVWSV